MWDELSDEERAAVRLLGFTRRAWSAQPRKVSVAWDELIDDEVSAAETLGFTAASWNALLPAAPAAFEVSDAARHFAEQHVARAEAMEQKRRFKLARAKRMQCELSVSDPATHVLMAVQSTVKVIEASLLDQVNLTCNLKGVLPRHFPADELDEYKRVAGEEMGQLCERITSIEERLRSLDLLARQLTVRVKRGTLAPAAPSPDAGRRTKSCSFAAAPAVQAGEDETVGAAGPPS